MTPATCHDCGAEVEASMEICPECGTTDPAGSGPVGRRGLPEDPPAHGKDDWVIDLMIVGLLILGALLMGGLLYVYFGR